MKYEGNDVTFELAENSVKINATEMAKPFGELKNPGQWLRTEASKEFIATLSDVHKCTSADLREVRKGGPPNQQGTYMHEDVALEFARWLNPKFGIWCNDRVKELITTGKTEMHTYVNWLPVILTRDEKKSIAHRLFSKAKLTQKSIASIIGVTEKTVSQWQKSGNWIVTGSDIFAISNIVTHEKIEVPKEIIKTILGAGPRNIRELLFEQFDDFVGKLNEKMEG